MHHYTLNTGHSRVSPRSEVGDDAISVCLPWLTPGEYPIPHVGEGYTIVVPRCEAGFAATIAFRGVPLATFGVADDAASAAEIWPPLERMYLDVTDRGLPARADWQVPRQPAVPWCSVVLLVPHWPDWLPDLERCVAWAWLESRRGKP